jgi:hypothetical protein
MTIEVVIPSISIHVMWSCRVVMLTVMSPSRETAGGRSSGTSASGNQWWWTWFFSLALNHPLFEGVVLYTSISPNRVSAVCAHVTKYSGNTREKSMFWFLQQSIFGGLKRDLGSLKGCED